MYFDTHCHLNFNRFENTVKEVIERAYISGVTHIVIPGADVDTSTKAVGIAEQKSSIFASVGIHPHHAKHIKTKMLNVESELNHIKSLLNHRRVVAVGEVGLDRHTYEKSKYGICKITEEDIDFQKKLLTEQINMALEHNKSLILHNREAVVDLLKALGEVWDEKLYKRTVFHCCEPDGRLLDFAIKHSIYIGADGDVTYNEEKMRFIQRVPLKLLVVETDSPYLLPEPLRSQKKYPNEPANIPIIIEKISEIKQVKFKEVAEITFANSIHLFRL